MNTGGRQGLAPLWIGLKATVDTTAEVCITKETLRTRKIQAKIYEVPTTHWSFSAFIPTLHQAMARLFSLLANPNPSIHKGEVLPISSVKPPPAGLPTESGPSRPSLTV